MKALIFPCSQLCCSLLLAMQLSAQSTPIQWTSRLWQEPVTALLPFNSRLYVAQPSGIISLASDGAAAPALLGTTAECANRFVFADGAVIGPALISTKGVPIVLPGLAGAKITGACRHPLDRLLCFLTEDGRLLGADLDKREVSGIFENMPKTIGLGSSRPNMRALFAAHDRLYVANDYDPAQAAAGLKGAGRLAEWDWRGQWRVVDSSPYVDIAGVEGSTGERSDVVFALGYDDLSVLLRVWTNNQWRRYRLPWRERPTPGSGNRIREISPQRWLMLGFGNFYLMEPPAAGIISPRVRPISASTEPLLDFCAWGGRIMLGGGQQDRAAGSVQAVLRETSLDALAGGPRPTGSGALWKNAALGAEQISEPFLIHGFNKKTVHATNETDQPMLVDIQVDATGDGNFKGLYRMEIPARSYVPYIFPQGYSGYWLRVKTVTPTVATIEVSFE